MAKELTYKRDSLTGTVYLDEGQTFNEEVAQRLEDFVPEEKNIMWSRRMEEDRKRLGIKDSDKKDEKKDEKDKKDKKDKKSIDDIEL